MAVDSSIAVSIKDNFSSGIGKMKKNLTDFEKKISDTGTKIDQLNKKKATIAVDVEKAKRELKSAQKEFNNTDAAAKRLATAEYNYSKLASELKSITGEANAAGKALNNLRNQQAKAENRAGGSSGSGISGHGISGGGSVLAKLGQAGAAKMIGDVVSQAAGVYVNSAFGGEAGNVFTSALSTAASGAAIGTAIAPGIGTAIGAAGGALLGGISGALQNFSNRDDFYKNLVSSQYEMFNAEMQGILTGGSTVASGREQSRLQFSTLLGGDQAAAAWVDWMQEYGTVTPFSFNDLAGMSRVGLSYGFNTEEIKQMLSAVGDAGSALGIQGADLSNVAAYLGRMNSSGKVTLEYLNPLIERGIPAIDYLAEALTDASETGKKFAASDVYEAISKGTLDGKDAARAIMGAMAENYGGSMGRMSETYAGKMSTYEDAQDQLNAAMGAGYNAEREKGLDNQIDYLSGASGTQVEEMYRLIGVYQASLENEKEAALRNALSEAMETNEYITARYQNDGAEMGRILAEAKAQAEADFAEGAGEEYQQQQIDIVNSISGPLATAYENMGYNLGLAMQKGLLASGSGTGDTITNSSNTILGFNPSDTSDFPAPLLGTPVPGHAAGISYIPHDDYIAKLHEGERVLTASENRAYGHGGNGPVVITGNSFTVREEADIDRIAEALEEKMEEKERLSWQ